MGPECGRAAWAVGRQEGENCQEPMAWVRARPVPRGRPTVQSLLRGPCGRARSALTLAEYTYKYEVAELLDMCLRYTSGMDSMIVCRAVLRVGSIVTCGSVSEDYGLLAGSACTIVARRRCQESVGSAHSGKALACLQELLLFHGHPYSIDRIQRR